MSHWLAILTFYLIHQWACPAALQVEALETSDLLPVKPLQGSSNGLPVLLPGQPSSATASKVIYIPPRVFRVLCWKGLCDPRLWEMAKRTPYYNFGLGKRSGDVTMEEDEEGEESGEFETGKRGGGSSGSRYNFGIGKKDDQDRRFNFGLGKRDQRYAFGLGKRDAEENALDDVEEGEEEEQEAADLASGNDKRQMYAFGLGKRNSPYNFGLGKREQRYAFGLGKRNAAYRYAQEGEKRNRNLYSFGLGKRNRMAYNFGLGKRRAEEEEEGETAEVDEAPETEGSENEKRSSPYSFGLGKRSADWKRNRYAFGLGKREAGPGPAPSETQGNSQHKVKVEEAILRTTPSPAKDLLH